MCSSRIARVAQLAAVAALCARSGLAFADVLPLAELEAQAQRKRPGVAASDARIAEARARVDRARSAYAPVITLVGDASLTPGSQLVQLKAAAIEDNTGPVLIAGSKPLGDAGAFRPFGRYGAMLDVRSNIYDFGRTGAAVDAAHAERRAVEAEAEKQAREIARDVRFAYVRWAVSDALHTLARESADAAEARTRSTSASIEEGARPSADRIAAQTDAGFARLDLERARANLETARLDLGLVCALDIPGDARPDAAVLADGTMPAVLDEQRDPALASLEEQRAAARATARVHDHAFAPVLSAQLQAGVQGHAEHVFPAYRLGVNLSVPLWDGGADAAARTEAEAHAAALAAQAAEYTQQRKRNATRTRAAREQAARRIQVAAELVELTRTRLAQLEEGYPLGAATLKDLADARAALQRARTELVLAQAMRAEAALGVSD